MKRKFIFVRDNNTPVIHVSDLLTDDRVIVLNGTCKELHNTLLRKLRSAHLLRLRSIDGVFSAPLKWIWGYSLQTVEWSADTEYHVIFECDPYPIAFHYLKKLKKKYHIKYTLLLLDSCDSIFFKRVQRYIAGFEFDYIFTFDPVDALRFGYIYTNVPYSILRDDKKENIEEDVYFNGSNKGRLQMLHGIYRQIEAHGLTSTFRIASVPAKEQKYEGIVYNERVDYSQIIRGIKHSNCIIEYLSGQQHGATLRYYEAVCYNKKLLTNNKNVVNLPFYNPDYIHVFENPEDIDWDWVKERIPVDYHYDGRFSPIHLIDKIIEFEEEKESQQNVKKETS